MKKVVIGISGGVDSAVAAFLLKKHGYDVQGVFMQNWDSYLNNENYDNHREKCDSQYEYDDALRICDYLDIPLVKVDFIKEYWNEVFEKFLNSYKQYKTPNPDVLCNKYIKFGHLLKYCLKTFDCDYIATGHYARVMHFTKYSELYRCVDENKDQTYFLCELSQEQLKYALFPLSHLTKQEVRQIAKHNNIPVWDKKDSTGICFIGERNFSQFLSNYLKDTEGDIVDITTGKKLGRHQGLMFYTIGQNNNLNLSGNKEKYYVCQKDIANNILYVARKSFKEFYLTSYKCVLKEMNWISKPSNYSSLHVRFRHRQKLIKCSIYLNQDQQWEIYYPSGAEAVTEGQYAVIYEDKKCLGGGEVLSVEK